VPRSALNRYDVFCFTLMICALTRINFYFFSVHLALMLVTGNVNIKEDVPLYAVLHACDFHATR
jgi:hypothetical protein